MIIFQVVESGHSADIQGGNVDIVNIGGFEDAESIQIDILGRVV